LHDKLVRRHPHVFGDVVAETADDVVDTWDSVKAAERSSAAERPSVFTGVAAAAPSLAYAQKVQKRAAGVGFDWPNAHGALAKIAEEAAEVTHAKDTTAREMEVGDLLFSVVNVARHLGVDAELALRKSADKFRRRFVIVEDLAQRRKIDLTSATLDELDVLWDEAKATFNS
jgi:MazG family protein